VRLLEAVVVVVERDAPHSGDGIAAEVAAKADRAGFRAASPAL
jgi:hypothetical protein